MFSRHNDDPIDAPTPTARVETDDNLTGTTSSTDRPGRVADGFVRCVHPDVAGTADLPVRALDRYRARGWVPVDTPNKED